LLLILWMCPAHLSLPLLIVLTISYDLYSWYNSWLYLSHHSFFSCTGPKILLNIFLSKVFRCTMSDCVSIHVSLAYVRIGLTGVVYSLVSLRIYLTIPIKNASGQCCISCNCQYDYDCMQ
jgi:hypothetical protein